MVKGMDRLGKILPILLILFMSIGIIYCMTLWGLILNIYFLLLNLYTNLFKQSIILE